MKTTSITARLNYRADSEGCHALIIQVIHRRRRSILTTPYRLRPEEFDAQRGRAVAVNRTKSRRTLIREANECVALCTEELRAVCARLAASGKPYTASDITGAYRSGNDNRYVEASRNNWHPISKRQGALAQPAHTVLLRVHGANSRHSPVIVFLNSTNTRSLPSENTSNGAATVAIPFRSICAPCTPFIIEPGGAAMLRHTVTPSGRYRSNRPEPRNWPYPEACCEPLPAGISGRAN